MRKLRSIQVLRALAACSVVALHAYGNGNPDGPGAFRIGAAGVDLFFVISGFIMANVSRDKTAKDFMADRLWRIYPVWWVAALPWMIAFRSDWHAILGTVTLWPIWGAYRYPALTLGWTLSFEMLFYLAMTLAILTRPRVPLLAYAVLLLLGVTVRNQLVGFLGSPMVLEFLMGVLIAKLPRDDARFGLALILIGFMALAVSPFSIGAREIALTPLSALGRVALWGVPCAILTYGALSLEQFFKSRWFTPAVFIGDASYSIYLFHTIMTRILTVWWPLEAALGVGLGVGGYYLVEQNVASFRRGREAAMFRSIILRLFKPMPRLESRGKCLLCHENKPIEGANVCADCWPAAW